MSNFFSAQSKSLFCCETDLVRNKVNRCTRDMTVSGTGKAV